MNWMSGVARFMSPASRGAVAVSVAALCLAAIFHVPAIAQENASTDDRREALAEIRTAATQYAERLAGARAAASTATLLAQAKQASTAGDGARAVALLEEAVSAGGSYPVWLRLAQARAKHDARNALTAAAALQAVNEAETPAQRLDGYLVLANAVRAASSQLATGIEDVSNKIVSLTYQLQEKRSEVEGDEEKRAAVTATPDYRNLEDVRRQWEQTRLDLAQQFSASTARVRAVYDTLFDLLEVTAEDRAEYLNSKLPAPRVNFRLGALDDADGGDPRTPSWQPAGRFASACMQFTLPLVADPAKYRPYVTIYAATDTAGTGGGGETFAGELDADDYDLSVDDRRLCITGLRFGTSYKVLLKPGLPSRSGFAFAGDALEMTAPDRRAQVAFRSSTYLLPTFGARRVPMWTTNVDEVALHLRRLSDRALHREVALGTIGGAGGQSRNTDIALEPLWNGRLKVTGPQNERTRAHLPIGALLQERARWIAAKPASRPALRGADGRSLLGKVAGNFTDGAFITDPTATGSNLTGAWEPGVYALIGAPYTPPEPGGYVPSAEQREAALAGQPTQWFVVTDLGLAYYRSPSELHVAARSLRTGGAIVGARVELVAKNNRVLAAAETNAQGVVRFDARLGAGLGGNALAAVLAYCDADSPCQRYGDVRDGPTARAPAGAQTTDNAARNGVRLADQLARMPDDFSFVDFKRDSFDLSEHGVAGRTPPEFFDAYLTTERGIYRPGETMQATVLVRDALGETIDAPPALSFRLKGVDGRVISLASAVAQNNFVDGGALVPLILPTTLRTGVADLEVVVGGTEQAGGERAGRVIGKTQIRIDYFRPERVRLAFTDPMTWTRTLSGDGTVSVAGSANAQFLYGKKAGAGDDGSSDTTNATVDAPAADLVGKLEVRLQAATSPVAQCYDRFAFGLANEKFLTRLVRREAGRTGADGALAFKVDVTGVPAGSIPVQAHVSLALLDTAGQAATRTQAVSLQRDVPWIGIERRPRVAQGGDTGVSTVTLDLLALTPANGLRGDAEITYELFRERDRFVWYEDRNAPTSEGWQHRADVASTRVANGTVPTLEPTGPRDVRCKPANRRLSLDLPVGSYRIEARDASGAVTTSRFTVGASSKLSARLSPEILTVRAARTDFKVGETITLNLETPFEGNVLVGFVDGEKIVAWRRATTDGRQAQVEMIVPDAWNGRSIYALASVFRSGADGSVTMGPARALGVLHFSVNRNRRRLFVDLRGTPFQAPPAAELPVRLAVTGEGFDGQANVRLCMVDEGLINITAHPDPSPHAHFFGQRRLTFGLMDNYRRLLLSEATTNARSGGDFLARLFLDNYNAVEVLSHCEPVRRISFQNGVATISISRRFRNFSGTARLTAVVWNDEAMGAAGHDILLRNSVVADLQVPPFLRLGDRVRLPLILENKDGVEGAYDVAVDLPGLTDVLAETGQRMPAQGGLSNLTFTADLPRDARRTFYLEVAIPQTPATLRPVARVQLRRSGAAFTSIAAIDFDRTLSLSAPEVPVVQPVQTVRLPAGQSLRFTPDLLDRATLARLSARLENPRLQLSFRPANLLIAEPASGPRDEQVTQSLLRAVWAGTLLLSGGDLAKEDSDAKERLLQIANAVMGLQGPDGRFADTPEQLKPLLSNVNFSNDAQGGEGFFPDQGAVLWRTALALDFLRLAKASGVVDVPNAVLNKGARQLRQAIDGARDAARFQAQYAGGSTKYAISQQLKKTPIESVLCSGPKKPAMTFCAGLPVEIDLAKTLTPPNEGRPFRFKARRLPPGLTLDGDIGKITGTLAPGAARGGRQRDGTYPVTVSVSGRGFNPIRRRLTIKAVTPPPQLAEHFTRIGASQTTALDLAAKDKDPAGGPLRYTMLSGPRLGRAQLSPQGRFVYLQDPARPLTGSVQIIYRADSPSGGAALGAVVVDRSNCTHELAYAAQVDTAIAGLLGDDAEKTLQRLSDLVEVCSADPSSLEIAMLSGALRAFGKPQQASQLLTKASFEPRPLALAQIRSKLKGAEFGAMVLAGLVSADAPARQIEDISQRLLSSGGGPASSGALTAAAKFWLARSALDAPKPADGSDPALSLTVEPAEARDRAVVLENTKVRVRTNFFSRAELGARGRPVITIANNGAQDAIATIIMRGLPNSVAHDRAAGAPGAGPKPRAPKLSVQRRYFRNVGGRLRPIDPQDATIALNELVFVLLEARIDQETSKSSVLVDILPSGFDVVTPDLLSDAAPEGAVDPRAFLGGPRGTLRFAEGRGDRFIALVAPGSEPSADGPNVRVAYAARATVAGELALPATLLEDETDPAISARRAYASKLRVVLPPPSR